MKKIKATVFLGLRVGKEKLDEADRALFEVGFDAAHVDGMPSKKVVKFEQEFLIDPNSDGTLARKVLDAFCAREGLKNRKQFFFRVAIRLPSQAGGMPPIDLPYTGKFCPVCGNKTTEFDGMVPGEVDVTQAGRCWSCRAEWVEHFQFLKYSFQGEENPTSVADEDVAGMWLCTSPTCLSSFLVAEYDYCVKCRQCNDCCDCEDDEDVEDAEKPENDFDKCADCKMKVDKRQFCKECGYCGGCCACA